MDLYVIRHADAEPLGAGGIQEDADRPLTSVGHAQAPALAAALQKQEVRLDKVVTSPLLRARQTAEGLIKKWSAPVPELQVCDLLAPDGKRRKLTRFLADLDCESVAIVGHMPDLNIYLAWLIGSKTAQIELAKAGCAHLHFSGKLDKNAGVLHWLITPEWCAPDPS